MKYFRTVATILVILALSFGAAFGFETTSYFLNEQELIAQLQAARFRVVEVGEKWGVRYVSIQFPMKAKIETIFPKIPMLQAIGEKVVRATEVFNQLERDIIRSNRDRDDTTQRKNVDIPLTNATPRIFPEWEERLAAEPQFISVSNAQQFLGYYEYGNLKYTFAVSTARQGRITPRMKGVICQKIRHHHSHLSGNVSMPYSMRLKKRYLIHEGVMPGQPDSAGCVRMFEKDAALLFSLVKVGTPFEVK